MSQPQEENFLTVLRWMRDELNLTSAIYRTKAGNLAIDPAVSLDSDGNPIRAAASPPRDVDGWFLSSTTGLVACCHMDALGKVTQRGDSGYALNAFAKVHMRDLVAECTAKGGDHSLETLFRIYRCGFAHSFASAKAAWNRLGRDEDYWYSGPEKPGLNVDRLAKGVLAGIDHFEEWFGAQVASGAATYGEFFEWLDAREARSRS